MRLPIVFLLLGLLLVVGCSKRPLLVDRFIPQNGSGLSGVCPDVPSDAYALNVCTLNQNIAYYDLRNVSDDPYTLVVA